MGRPAGGRTDRALGWLAGGGEDGCVMDAGHAAGADGEATRVASRVQGQAFAMLNSALDAGRTSGRVEMCPSVSCLPRGCHAEHRASVERVRTCRGLAVLELRGPRDSSPARGEPAGTRALGSNGRPTQAQGLGHVCALPVVLARFHTRLGLARGVVPHQPALGRPDAEAGGPTAARTLEGGCRAATDRPRRDPRTASEQMEREASRPL